MKKILALILAMSFVCTAAFAATENENVDISFRVGDSVLQINGNAVEVETPYVVGEGTTLVPLRVISEAFGATVTWEGETKSITIDYMGNSIFLQIDNSVTTVNGSEKLLSEPPRLSESGFTMVPLRFISEELGADVGYDDATRAITVKRKEAESTATPTPTPTPKPTPGQGHGGSSPSSNKPAVKTPAPTMNPSGPKLSEDDVKAIAQEYGGIRYMFEQKILPEKLFSEEDKDIANQEEFSKLIYDAWTIAANTYIVNIAANSETEYQLSSDAAVAAFAENVALQCGLDSGNNIEQIDYYDSSNNDKLAIITMKDCDELLISKYLGIRMSSKDGDHLYTLENSFNGTYMLCEIRRDGRVNYGVINRDYDEFVSRIEEIGAEA